MKKLFLYFTLIPLLISCQEFKTKPYDKEEEKLRSVYPAHKLTKLIIRKDWEKRDSLSYLRFKNIVSLYLVDTDSIPSWVTKFAKLNQIQIMGESNIKFIPQNIGNLANLNYLNGSNSQISEIPVSIKKLKKLKGLSLNNNKLTHIPNELGELENLDYLLLSDNKLNEIPSSICKLKKLNNLSLSNNDIKALPSCIDELTQLSELSLNENQIKQLPEGLFKLPNLTSFTVDDLPLDNKNIVKDKIDKLTYNNRIRKKQKSKSKKE